TDEPLGRRRLHDLHVVARAHQQPDELTALVGGDAPTNADQNHAWKCRPPPRNPKARRGSGVLERGLLARGADLELALGDLLEGHRQEVLRAGLDQRRGEALEAALAELMVVVVDLAGALRGRDHQAVLAVDVLQQLVDLRFDHRGAPSLSIADRMTDSSSSAARSLLSFTITCSNSPAAPISLRAIASRAWISSEVFAPRPARRSSRSARSGGAMNTSTASGSCRLISRAPGTSISSTTLSPSASRRSTSLRSVPYRCPANVTCSRNAPSPASRANSWSDRKWYSRPSVSAGRRGRVVADVATSSSGSDSRARAISVPLPTPEGPEITTSLALIGADG